MDRRRVTSSLLAVAVLTAIALLPSIAWADGSDTGAFARYAGQSTFIAILVSFGFGVIASLTPCVFPMVPITVSIFGATEAKSRARGAALSASFVLGIAIPFTIIGVASAASGKLMGSALSNPIVVLVIAVIFATLAASMFGAFEMTLPSSITNRASTVGGIGFRGAFVLGAVMSIVAAPCTGPFLTGMVVWISSTKNLLIGGVAMFSFALGLGLIFFVAGTFAVNLPKGGAWMLGIKWGSGVALAYMSLAYLRDGFPAVAKIVAHPSTAYGIVAGVIFVAGLALGTVHVIAERRKSPIAHLSKPMKLASIVPAIGGAFAFITWMNMPKPSVIPDAAAAEVGKPAAGPIAWKTDEKAALAEAATEKKPVLVDFGATWCKGCKELEEVTWPDPRIRTEAARFVSIKVDASDDDNPETKRLSSKYHVVGLPTVILIDAAGKEISRFNEFEPAEKILPALASVH